MPANNTLSLQLASGTATDFGIWSPEQKSVSKHKSISNVKLAAWLADSVVNINHKSNHLFTHACLSAQSAMITDLVDCWS
jgi:intraflagellar transport protein 122